MSLRLGSAVLRAGPRHVQACRAHATHVPFKLVACSSSIPRRQFGTISSFQAPRKSNSNDTSATVDGKRQPAQSWSAKEHDRPWHYRDGDTTDEIGDVVNGANSNGRILTTPTRLLKLILPLPFDDQQETINETPKKQSQDDEQNSASPLALLVHPHQPLSYLERLIQAEIPPLKIGGREKSPDVVFWAEVDEEATPERSGTKGSNVASYSGLGREGPTRKDANWVRWSGSTEVGDFIRDAARGREFAVDIEGYDKKLRVAVPSFKDRTHYMRMRLRRMSRQIDEMARVKSQCDMVAHKGAHRLAQGGFAALASWWGTVYYVTFHTDMGWDMIEPVTYLAGLTTIMAGYLWFLFISKDLSYKAAMNITVSKRQNALYQERGFNLTKWEHLVQQANMLRGEIRIIASEYDVDWDETKDLGGNEVKQALEKEEKKKGKKEGEEEDEDEDKGKEKKRENGRKKDDDDDHDRRRDKSSPKAKK